MFLFYTLSHQRVNKCTIAFVIAFERTHCFLMRESNNNTALLQKTIDLFSLGGLLSHFRPCDKNLENSCFQIFK